MSGARVVSSKPPGDEGAQARKYPVDNSRVIEISAYAPRAKRQYRGKRFDQRGKLSSHGCRERRVHIAEAAANRKYFGSCFWREFVGMAIDNHLMLISEVRIITAARDRKRVFVDSETR